MKNVSFSRELRVPFTPEDARKYGENFLQYSGQMAEGVRLSDDVPLDVVATWDVQSEAVSVGLINYSPDNEVSVKLRIKGSEEPRNASRWRIHGPTSSTMSSSASRSQSTGSAPACRTSSA